MTGCQVDLYIQALARRKSIGKDGAVNMAILYQLENKDWPLVLEMLTQQDAALKRVIELVSVEGVVMSAELADEMAMICSAAHLRVEELASTGSCATFGPYQGNGSKKPDPAL